MLALSILVVLTLLGLASMQSTIIDLKISGNEREVAREFQVIDGLTDLGRVWLDSRGGESPLLVNVSRSEMWPEDSEMYRYVRNFGNGGDGVLNEDFAAVTADGVYMGIPFWFRVAEMGASRAVGCGDEFRDYHHKIETTAGGRTRIVTHTRKVFRSGAGGHLYGY